MSSNQEKDVIHQVEKLDLVDEQKGNVHPDPKETAFHAIVRRSYQIDEFEKFLFQRHRDLFPNPPPEESVYDLAISRGKTAFANLVRSFQRNPASCLVNICHKHRSVCTKELLELCIVHNDASSLYACLELQGGDPNAVFASGYSAAQTCLLLDQSDCLKALLDHPTVDPNRVVNGDSLVSLAAKRARDACLRMVVNHPKATLHPMPNGQSILAYRQPAVNLEILLACPRVNINALDKDGCAYIHHLVRRMDGNEELRRLLDDLRTDPGIMTPAGQTPLMIAAEKNDQPKIRMLAATTRIKCL